MQIEQSNAILRKMKHSLEYLIRITVMNECFQDEYFCNSKTEYLLDSFIEPCINQMEFCGMTFKFLNYSAS